MTNGEVLSNIYSYVKPYYPRFIIAFISLIMIAVSNAGFAKLMEDMIETVEHKTDSNFIAPLILLVVFAVRALSTVMSTYTLSWIGQRIVMNIRIDLFNYLMVMPSKNYDTYRQSELISMISNRTTSLATGASQSTIIVFQDFFTVLGLIGVMLYQSLLLSVSILFALPFMAYFFVSSRKVFMANTALLQKGDAAATGKIIEAVKGYRSIRIYNAQKHESDLYSSVSNGLFKVGVRSILLRSVLSPLMQFMVMLIFIVIVYLSTFDYFNENISGGAFVSFLFALFMTLTPLKRLSQFSHTYYTIVESGRSLFTFLHGKKEENTGTVEMKSTQGRIEFDEASFSYNPKKTIINKLSFSMEPRTMVALVGRSGSGKTTTMNLIPRFYNVQDGDILIDGRSIKEYTLNSLRRHISYVGQDIVLNDATVYENVSYGELSKASKERVEEACELACAHEFILKLQDGYETMIGDNGQFLSGGQRQRISIARAFLKQSSIILMDEPTSALDNESDKFVREAIQTLKQRSSIMVIAHRLATTQAADLILVMDKGKIVEKGTHDELYKKGDLYYHLCSTAIH